jgi:hypothetical protein
MTAAAGVQDGRGVLEFRILLVYQDITWRLVKMNTFTEILLSVPCRNIDAQPESVCFPAF